VLFIAPDADPDAAADRWLAEREGAGTTADLTSLPVFGYPGWLPGTDSAAFYDDTRYFRPFRRPVAAAR
jgi:hypothetical protein